MAVKKQGLGKGLHALLKGALSQNDVSHATLETRSAVKIPVHEKERAYAEVSIKLVVPGPSQPRQNMDVDSLQELSESIREQGILQPLVVRMNKQQQYEIIAGERRYQAAKMAGLSKVPVMIKEVSDETAVAMALIENMQRSDLNPLEEAVGLDRLTREFRLTHQQVAQAVGKSRTTITNLLRLLTLNEDVKDLLSQQKIEFGHAKVLLGIRGTTQSHLAQTVADKGLSVRETEKLLQNMELMSQQGGDTAGAPPIDPNVRVLQDELAERLCAKVVISCQPSGKGKLVIHYHTLDELDGILSHIR